MIRLKNHQNLLCCHYLQSVEILRQISYTFPIRLRLHYFHNRLGWMFLSQKAHLNVSIKTFAIIIVLKTPDHMIIKMYASGVICLHIRAICRSLSADLFSPWVLSKLYSMIIKERVYSIRLYERWIAAVIFNMHSRLGRKNTCLVCIYIEDCLVLVLRKLG